MGTNVKVLTVAVGSGLVYRQTLANWLNGGCTIINSGHIDGCWYATAQLPASTPTKRLQFNKNNYDCGHYIVDGVDLDKLNTKNME